MVYCGKPSKVCALCRKRNLKCDKKRDSCGQCIRAKLQCPGYTDPRSLVFRDETRKVIQKVSQPPKQSIIQPPTLYSLEAKAKWIFISQQVFGNEATPNLYFMRAFYPVNPKDTHLIHSIQAASLAYLAKSASGPTILAKARKQYSSALALTNQALCRPEDAHRDITLMTVILLNFFEKLMEQIGTVRDVDCGAKHLEGALVLTKLRGKAQFEDRHNVRMFMHLVGNILTNCLKHGGRIPIDMLELCSQAAPYVNENDVEQRVLRLAINLSSVQRNMEMKRLTHDEYTGLLKDFELEYWSIKNVNGSKCEGSPTLHAIRWLLDHPGPRKVSKVEEILPAQLSAPITETTL